LVAVAVAWPGRRRPGVGGALAAVAAEEVADLGLQGGLQPQPHAEPGDLFQDQSKILAAGEQLIDLGADTVGRR
jgi:hypothetical protein